MLLQETAFFCTFVSRCFLKSDIALDLNEESKYSEGIGLDVDNLIIDGAGWVARQSDLNKIHRCSDYLINLNSIGMMDTIIEYYL